MHALYFHTAQCNRDMVGSNFGLSEDCIVYLLISDKMFFKWLYDQLNLKEDQSKLQFEKGKQEIQTG